MLTTAMGIRKGYKNKQVLKEASLTLEEGCICGILGKNGCGKSTLLSVLSGMRSPEAGSFTMEAEETYDLFRNKEAHRKLVGFVPQGELFMPELSALDHLRLWYSMADEDLEKDLEEGVPQLLGVGEFLRKPVSALSGGMKKRLAISCAVAHKPRLLLLDEPTAALDLLCRDQICEYLTEFAAQGGQVLLAAHDLQELSICTKMYHLTEGILEPMEKTTDPHRIREILERS